MSWSRSIGSRLISFLCNCQWLQQTLETIIYRLKSIYMELYGIECNCMYTYSIVNKRGSFLFSRPMSYPLFDWPCIPPFLSLMLIFHVPNKCIWTCQFPNFPWPSHKIFLPTCFSGYTNSTGLASGNHQIYPFCLY